MIHWEVSWLPLVGVAVANFILSWLYYSPMAPWFRAWAREARFDPNREITDADRKNLPILFGGAIFSSFALAYGLQVAVHSLAGGDPLVGALVALAIWATFTLPYSLNTLFEGRSPGVLVINHGLLLVTYAGFGALTAVWA